MGVAEVEAFLTHLAAERNVSAATHNQAFSALLFLYRVVLKIELRGINALRARRPKKVPTVLTGDEAKRVLASMTGPSWLVTSLLYGSGLRLREALSLRVQDLEFGHGKLFVRDPKSRARSNQPTSWSLGGAPREPVEGSEDLAEG